MLDLAKIQVETIYQCTKVILFLRRRVTPQAIKCHRQIVVEIQDKVDQKKT
jgi:hypothetical protein